MKHYDETPAFTATGQPNFTLPPDPLTASRLKPQEGRLAAGLDLGDLLHSLRASLAVGVMPEAETMLAAQMHLMNAAFNRLVMAGTNTIGQDGGAAGGGADPYAIDVAIRVQRRCVRTLEALETRMGKITGKTSGRKISGKQTNRTAVIAGPMAEIGE